MAVSYKKLWKLLIDKDMKKKDLKKRLVLVHLLWQNWVKTKMLRPMCL
jgi:DNA-binding Xre family transcriptional regulator